jgi:hypothetical protein
LRKPNGSLGILLQIIHNPKGIKKPMTELNEAQLLTVVKNVVEKFGCKITNFDFDKKIINIEGPEEAKADCARAIVDILG